MIRLICGRIGRLFTSFFALIQRALCFANRRDNIGELPYHVKSSVRSSLHGEENVPLVDGSSPSSVDVHGRGGDWGEPNWDQQVIVENKIEEFRRKKSEKSADTEDEPSIDFFSDMAPKLTKTKVLRPVPIRAAPQRNLFEFSETAIPVDELGIIEDEDVVDPAWEDSNIDSLLDEERQRKREERLAQHARRNEERRMARLSSS